MSTTEPSSSIATTYDLLKYFAYQHLPPHLQDVSKDFSKLAHQMACRGNDIAETKVGIRKLLEAKDCAVRSCLTEEMTKKEGTKNEKYVR